MTFESKRDAGMLVLAGAGALFLMISLINTWRGSAGMATRGWVTSLCVLGLGVIVWTALRTRYVLDDEVLEIRSGPLRYKLTLASIRSVEPMHGFDFSATSPAWSLDRLRITTDAGEWLISPRDKAAFLEALGAREARLRRDGERLVRGA